MKRLRVVHLIVDLDPALGGPPVVAARLAAAQSQLGCDVTLLSYRTRDGGSRADNLIRETPSADRLHVHQINDPGRIERLTGRRAASAYRNISNEGVDILHTHGMWEPMMPATAAVARKHGVPYIVTPHGMLDPYTLSVKRQKKRIALATTHRSFLRKAAFVHMLNQDEATLAEPVLHGTPTRVIPNGIFLEEIDRVPPPGSFRTKYPRLGEAPYVLFLSRLAHKKGLDYLAESFAKLHDDMPDVHLVVAGPNDGEREGFEASIADHGLQHIVHVVGPQYGDDKLASIRDASVFCLPSRQEGFSIAITEALAMGLPVVISRACHYPEVTEVGAGIETDLDPTQIADALRRILSDRAESTRMGQAGARLVRERFTWPMVARRTLECYHSVLPGKTI